MSSWRDVALELSVELGEREDWLRTARPEQLPSVTDWQTWLVCAGRAWGKTRCGAEQVAEWARHNAGCRIALVGATAADVRDVMICGESGLLSVCSGLIYEPSKRKLRWPNGSMAYCYSAEEPRRLRGPQHGFAWSDELAAWEYPQDTWDMLQMGLRLGKRPQQIITTTPRPIPLLRRLITSDGVVVTRGSTLDNADNLPSAFVEAIKSQYEGTRIGRQELHAEILTEAEGALWTHVMIDAARVAKAPELHRVVVAIDPAATSKAESDETGIVVCGSAGGHYYVLADYSGRYSPDAWARKAATVYELHEADRIVAESNQGGEMVSHTLRTVNPTLPVTLVHASKGKRVRAEPIAAMYEQGRVHHVGTLGALEDQLCEWDPTSATSPDRLDAMVWGLTDMSRSASACTYAQWRSDDLPKRRF